MFRRFLWILFLVIASIGATVVWSQVRLHEFRSDSDRRLEASARIARDQQQELDRLRSELDRLESWGHLVDFQEDLRKIDLEIESLNYGNALEKLEALESRIRTGEMGALLADSSSDLEDELATLRAELSAMGEDAGIHLRALGRRAFEALTGFAAEIEVGVEGEDGLESSDLQMR